MMGRWTPLEEIDKRLCLKIGTIIGHVGPAGLQQLGKTRQAVRQEAYQSLKAGAPVPPPSAAPGPAQKAKTPQPSQRIIYVLDPNKKFTPKAKTPSLASEYGLR
jgi:hypothetical protein